MRYSILFYRETPNSETHEEAGFVRAFLCAVDAPREAIKDQFFSKTSDLGYESFT